MSYRYRRAAREAVHRRGPAKAAGGARPGRQDAGDVGRLSDARGPQLPSRATFVGLASHAGTALVGDGRRFGEVVQGRVAGQHRVFVRAAHNSNERWLIPATGRVARRWRSSNGRASPVDAWPTSTSTGASATSRWRSASGTMRHCWRRRSVPPTGPTFGDGEAEARSERRSRQESDPARAVPR